MTDTEWWCRDARHWVLKASGCTLEAAVVSEGRKRTLYIWRPPWWMRWKLSKHGCRQR